MIDPRRLLVLRAVAAGGSIAQAAKSLNLTPPAVSQQLAALERETGVALVDRSHHRATLTVGGRLLAATAERISAELVNAERQLADLTGQLTGPVRIAAFQSVMRDLVAPALQRTASDHPAVKPIVIERHGPTTIEDLLRGDLDVVIYEHDVENPFSTDARLSSVSLAYDPYRVVIPSGWQPRPNTIHDLAARRWIGGPPGTACDDVLRRLHAQGTLRGEIIDTCVEFPSVLALVAAERGAAIVPQLALHDEAVTTCPHIDLGGRQIGAMYVPRRGEPTPAVRAMLDALAARPESRGRYRFSTTSDIANLAPPRQGLTEMRQMGVRELAAGIRALQC